MLIYNPDLLYEYWDAEGSFRAAFCRWGQDIIDAMDRHTSPPDDDLNIDLGEIGFALDHAWGGLEQVELLRAILLPHHKDGITITRIASAASLPISTTVGALFNPSAERSFSRYVYGERWLLEYGPSSTLSKMERATMLSRSAIKLLCERHHVRAARYVRPKRVTSMNGSQCA